MSRRPLIESTLFRRACAQFGTGVAIASALDSEGQPHGMTVNSFASVSMNPPQVLICVDRTANLLGIFDACGHYGLSFLGDHQRELSARFAQRGQNRFDGTEWQAGGATGVPLIPGALAHLECRIEKAIASGDHVVLIAEVVSADILSGTPLLFFDSGYRRLG